MTNTIHGVRKRPNAMVYVIFVCQSRAEALGNCAGKSRTAHRRGGLQRVRRLALLPLENDMSTETQSGVEAADTMEQE